MNNRRTLNYLDKNANKMKLSWCGGIRVLLAFCIYLASSVACAVNISGQVEIWSKNQQDKLKEFDHALVYLDGMHSSDIPNAAIVDQKNKQFQPRILPIVKGQAIDFYNQDPISHNVFSTDKKMPFDLGRYPQGEFKKVTYSQKGFHKVYCNIHQSMILDVVVLDNPYFAVTDEQGNFTIGNVPAGSYQLKVWHIYGGEHTQDLVVENASIQLDKIKLVNTSFVKDVIRHKNKEGEDYRNKRRGKRGRY